MMYVPFFFFLKKKKEEEKEKKKRILTDLHNNNRGAAVSILSDLVLKLMAAYTSVGFVLGW